MWPHKTRGFSHLSCLHDVNCNIINKYMKNIKKFFFNKCKENIKNINSFTLSLNIGFL